MAQSLFDRLMPAGIRRVDPELPFSLMGLNALVFLPLAGYRDALAEIFGADLVSSIAPPTNYDPAVLVLRSSGRVILAFQGKIGRAHV